MPRAATDSISLCIFGRTYVDNLTKAVTEAGATLVLGSEAGRVSWPYAGIVP